ncbi:MAG: hypothetical protein DLM72_16355, partial [Candidatus Nitrosopolaris wilkensis]
LDLKWRKGGNDPFIICEDADVKASDVAVNGSFINCGQTCIASNRLSLCLWLISFPPFSFGIFFAS